jgi:hypothetical protein
MTLVVDQPFDTYVPAATLLAERGKQAEAVPFLRDRVKAVPWDDEARLHLARLLRGQEKVQVLTVGQDWKLVHYRAYVLGQPAEDHEHRRTHLERYARLLHWVQALVRLETVRSRSAQQGLSFPGSMP